MGRLAIRLLLIAAPLWGCATQNSPEVLLNQALRDQDAAYLRLTNAIGRYCSVSNNSFESSQNCVLEKLTVLRAEQARKVPSLSDLSMMPALSLSVDEHPQVANVNCARTRIATTCHRVPPPVTQTGLN
ncbi:MAG TPA: hypothetical protein VEI50_12720 [Nitrospiraceae bacterium]|nr:hypothetical protein [Nitrospiraceae bacterium]